MSDPIIEEPQAQPQDPNQAVPAEAVSEAAVPQNPDAVDVESIDPEDAGKSPEQLLKEVLAGPLPDGSEVIPLPSGVVAVMRPGKGRDLLAAQRAAGTDSHLVMYGLIAQLCTFNEQKKVMEDTLEMPLGDVMRLFGKIGETGGDFLPSTSAPSSISRP